MENNRGKKLKGLGLVLLSLTPYIAMLLVLASFYFWWPETIRFSLIGITALAWTIKLFSRKH